MDWLSGDFSSAPLPSTPLMLLALLLAFACGLVGSWIYILTHTGLSYSKSFVNSLVILPVIVSLVMMVMANNLITAFGLMAVFAIVRFRNILRDTLDTVHILTAIVVGMACGTLKFSTALLGCGVSAFILVFLWWTAYGARHRYDMILNVHWERPDLSLLEQMLYRHGQRVVLASRRTTGGAKGSDLSYRLLMRDPSRSDELINELTAMEGVARVTGLRAEDESET